MDDDQGGPSCGLVVRRPARQGKQGRTRAVEQEKLKEGILVDGGSERSVRRGRRGRRRRVGGKDGLLARGKLRVWVSLSSENVGKKELIFGFDSLEGLKTKCVHRRVWPCRNIPFDVVVIRRDGS